MKCPGCGTDFEPEEDHKLCKRCFQIIHYGKGEGVIHQFDILQQIPKFNTQLFYLIDLIDFESTFDPSILEGRNAVLLVNKIDLLPKNSNQQRILNWVKSRVQNQDLKIELISAKMGWGIERLRDLVTMDTYVVGHTNTGKSTLIKQLIQSKYVPAASPIPGTTLGFIEFPLNKWFLFDSPGQPNWNAIRWGLQQVRIKPINVPLLPGQTLLLGAMASFKLLSSAYTIASVQVPSKITVHRTSRPEEMIQKHAGALLYPALQKEVEWKEETFTIETTKKLASDWDLGLKGFGWVTFGQRGEAKIQVKVPNWASLYLRKSLLPFEIDWKNLDKKRGSTFKTWCTL